MTIAIDHSGTRALVTGAGAGIGAAIARWLARAGATVAVHDVRADKAVEVVASIEAEGAGKAFPLIADARDDDALEAMIAEAAQRLGGLDVAALVEATPLRRMTEPDELARLAVFLSSDLARCITGQLILADAGAHLSRTRPPNHNGSKEKNDRHSRNFKWPCTRA